MESPLRIAVVGLGWVALHRHVPALLRNTAFNLVGVIDRHKGHAAAVARKLNLPHAAETDRLSDVTWLDEIDALSIAAPPFAHHDLVCAALRAGKHVLTEKPFAMSIAQGEAMAAVAQDTGRTLCVMHNFQFSRAAHKLARDLAAGKLGTVRRIAATQLGNPRRRLPAWYEDLPLGLFYDESPHFFYLLQGLAQGRLSLEQAYGLNDAPRRTPRHVHLFYRDEASTPITIDCAFDSAISEWFVRVSGDKGVGILDIFRDIYIRLPNDGEHGALHILRTSACAIAQHTLQHIPNGLAHMRGRLDYGNDAVFTRFAQAIRSGNQDDKIGFAQALRALKLQHEAIDAIGRNLIK